MHRHLLGAALAVLLGSLLAGPARSDIVDITDGKDGIRLPKKITSRWGTAPSDIELGESGQRNLKLAYDAFELGGEKGDSAQLVDVYVTECFENEQFNDGEKYGESGFWQESAEAFAQAAEVLTGAARQVALHKRMLALANLGDDAGTLAAADALLADDPKSYYFGPTQEIRARIFARRGKRAEATAALKLVTDAPGMNVRDYFNAMYLSTWLTKTVGADKPEKWAAAETAYRSVLGELDKHARKQLAQIPRFRVLMSLGESLRGQGKADEAKKYFDLILAEANVATDKGVLAGVYYGLGDAAYDEAARLQSAPGGTQTTREKVVELLNQAGLYYLRVVLLYKDYAGQRELYGATRGAAKAFSTLFTITGEKDCEIARRAYEFYRQAHQMSERGEAQRLLFREGQELKQKIDAVCGKAGGEEAGAASGAPPEDADSGAGAPAGGGSPEGGEEK